MHRVLANISFGRCGIAMTTTESIMAKLYSLIETRSPSWILRLLYMNEKYTTLCGVSWLL